MSTELSVNDALAAAPAPSLASEAGQPPAPDSMSRLLDRLLAMADTLRAQGKLHQAIELYFTLVEAHAGTGQAGQAFDRLVQIAERYDEAGERHQARSLYERLLLSEN